MGLLTKQLRWGLLLGLGLPVFMLGIALLNLEFELKEVDKFAGSISPTNKKTGNQSFKILSKNSIFLFLFFEKNEET